MSDDLLARVPGQYVAEALQKLPPAESASAEVMEALVDVPNLGTVRITAKAHEAQARQGGALLLNGGKRNAIGTVGLRAEACRRLSLRASTSMTVWTHWLRPVPSKTTQTKYIERLNEALDQLFDSLEFGDDGAFTLSNYDACRSFAEVLTEQERWRNHLTLLDVFDIVRMHVTRNFPLHERQLLYSAQSMLTRVIHAESTIFLKSLPWALPSTSTASPRTTSGRRGDWKSTRLGRSFWRSPSR